MKYVILAGAMVAIGALAGAAQAQSYPSQAVTVIVPFAAGGGTDAVARVLAERLGAELGQRVVVENRPGANGAVGTTAVSLAEPDGHTILMTTSSAQVVTPHMVREATYDPVEDFAPIARLGNFPFVLTVNPDLPVESVAELLAYGEDNPGELTYAYWQGTTIIAGSVLRERTGLDILGVPFTGTTPAITDVVAGRVSAIFIDLTSGLSHIEAGALKPLAVTTAEPSNLLPDVPSMSEAGVEDYDISSWMAAYAPAGTPDEIVETLSEAILGILADPATADRLAELGFDVQPADVAELDAFTRSEYVMWGQFVTDAGLELQ